MYGEYEAINGGIANRLEAENKKLREALIWYTKYAEPQCRWRAEEALADSKWEFGQ